jgi:hypothetical protein
VTQALSIFNGLANASPDQVMSCLTAFGQQLAQSRIMGIQTHGDGLVVAVTCAAEGITPLEFARTYHIIEGRPSMKADAMLAKFKAAGGKVKWLDFGDTEQKAEAEFTYGGETVSMAFTIDQAKKMVGEKKLNNTDGNWYRLRPQMLRARLVTTALRVIAPELIVGIYTPEEIEDFATPSKPNAEQVAARREEYAAMANEAPVVSVTATTVVEKAPPVVVEQAPVVTNTSTQEPPAAEVPFDTGTVIDAVVETADPFPKLGDTEPVPPSYTKELVTILVKHFGQSAASAEQYLREKLKCPDLSQLQYQVWAKTHEMLKAKAPK